MKQSFSGPNSPPPVSPARDSRNFTEVSGMNGINNQSKISDLSQTAQAFAGMKARYDGLLGMFDSGSRESSGSNSVHNGGNTRIGEISQHFLADESAEIEVQQWNTMWTHLVSMISQVIDINQCLAGRAMPKTGNEKRAILVDLVSRLCELKGPSKTDEDFKKLQRKYQKTKQLMEKLRNQGNTMMQEVQKNKEMITQHLSDFGKSEDNELNAKIRELEELLRIQVEKQTQLLAYDLRRHNKRFNKRKQRKTANEIVVQEESEIDEQTETENDSELDELDDDDEYEEEDIEEVIASKNEQIRKIAKSIKQIEQRKGKNKGSKPEKKQVDSNYLVKDIKDRIVNHQKKQIEDIKYIKSQQKRSNIERRKSPKNKISQYDDIADIKDAFDTLNKIENVKSQNARRITRKAKTQIEISDSSSDDTINKFIPRTQPPPKRRKVYKEHTDSEDFLGMTPRNIEIQFERKKKPKSSNIQEFDQNIKRNIRKTDDTLPKNCKQIRKTFGNNVNQLVDVTNNLKNDYRRLRHALGNDSSSGSDLSIEQLSKIHDSLLSVEQQFDQISD